MPKCRLCDSKPARKIPSNYKYAVKEPTFCSMRCAAHFGLIQMNFSEEYWCRKCGTWTQDCDHEPA